MLQLLVTAASCISIKREPLRALPTWLLCVKRFIQTENYRHQISLCHSILNVE